MDDAFTSDPILASFAVQRLVNDRWTHVSSHHNKADALAAAEVYCSRNQQFKVRVVQAEFYGDTSNLAHKVISVYKPAAYQKEALAQRQETAVERLVTRAQTRRRREKLLRIERARERRLKWRARLFYAKIVITFLLINAAAIAALQFLKHLG